MLTTRFTRLIGCDVPIQQAGMGGVATAELASAVALAGALGMIGGVRLVAKVLTEELDSLPRQTRSRIGVNFLVPFLDRESLEVAASRVRVVEFFFGEPDADLVERAHGAGALAAWQIGSVEEARAAAGADCDFLVAQGIEAGGHVRGRLGLLPLLDGVLDAVNVPVLAAGGIATARAMAAALAAGADGVRVGTRFVAAAESAAHPAYQEALLRAEPEDTILTEAYSANWPNAPHRVLRGCIEAAQALTDDLVGQTVTGGATLPLTRFMTPPPARWSTGKIEAMPRYALLESSSRLLIRSHLPILKNDRSCYCPLLKSMSEVWRESNGVPSSWRARVERLMPLTLLHVLYFDAKIEKTDTCQSGGRLPEGFFAKKNRTTDRAHFLSEGPLPA